jgi:hypothetical protein
MHRQLASAALVVGLGIAAPAGAQSLAFKGGTSGVGAEVGLGLGSMFGVRANLLGGSISRDETDSGIRYDGKLKLSSGSLLFDVHPFAGTFRLTAGLTFNDNKVDATAQPAAGTIEINGVNYPAEQVGTLQAAVRFEKTAPYLGLGWGTRPSASSGLFFSVDLGAFLSKPTATLNGTCGPSLPAPACTQLQADIRAEQQQFQDEIKDFKAYPVLSVGLGYRF